MVEEKLDKIVEKLEKMDSRLDSIDVTLAIQKTQLGEHIARTAIAEARLDKIDDKLEPIQIHVGRVEGAVKAAGFGASILGVGAAIARFFRG
jgi:hypothetical protein